MTAIRAPRCKQAGIRRRAISSDFSSSLTAIRNAWKTRVAGSIRSPPGVCGTERRTNSANSVEVSSGLFPPATHDRLRDASGVALLAVAGKQLLQVFHAQSVDEASGWLARERIETQVERPFRGKAESSLGVGQLVARQSQVEHDAFDDGNLKLFQDLGQIAKVRMDRSNGKPGKVLLRGADRLRITIEAEHQALLADCRRQGPRVAASAQGSIDERLPGARRQPRDHLVQQDGHVDRLRFRHGIAASQSIPKRPTSGASLRLCEVSARGEPVKKATGFAAIRNGKTSCFLTRENVFHPRMVTLRCRFGGR